MYRKYSSSKRKGIGDFFSRLFCSAAFFLFLFATVAVPSFAKTGITAASGGDGCTPAVYGVVCAISLFLIACYCYFIREKEVWAILLFVSVFICNTGYFTLSVSTSLQEALLANRIAYFGSVFLVLFMLLIIVNICNVEYPIWLQSLFVCLSLAVFLLAASGGYSDVYYKEVSLEIINGTANLVKVYGPLHRVYYMYLFLYFTLMIAAIAYAVYKKKVKTYKHAAFLAAIVFGNIGIWLIEQLIGADFEFLSVSYVITEMLILFLHSILQEFEKIQPDSPDTSECNKVSSAPVPDVGSEESMDFDIQQIAQSLPEVSQLTSREEDVLYLILKNRKRKEIAEELCITEHTVKKHTSHIFSKLQVSSRNELYEKFRNR